MNGYANNYLANQVATASPEQLLLMLYDGAIRFASLAVKAIEAGDIEKRAYYINKTSAIIGELDATLDFDVDPNLAENLDALYHYMLRQLIDGNLGNRAQPVHEVIDMLRDLRQTWAEAIQITRQSAGEQASAEDAEETRTPSRLAASL